MTDAFRVIFSSAATGWIARATGVIVSLVTLPIILYHLGKVQYGIWVLVGQTIQFLTLTDLGVTNSVGRFVARFRVQESHDAIDQLITTAFLFLMLIGLMVALVTLCLSHLIPDLLKIDSKYFEAARGVFIINGISLAFLFPARIGRGILAGYQKYAVPNIAQTVGSLFTLAGILLLVWMKRLGLIELAIISAISVWIVQGISFAAGWRCASPVSCKTRNFSIALLKKILNLGTSTLMMTASAKIYRQGITICVGIFVGTAAAGIYGVALVLMTHISFLLTQISRPMTTLSSEMEATGNQHTLRDINNFVMKISFGLGLSVTACLLFYGEPFLHLLLKNSGWAIADFQNAGNSLIIMGIGLTVGIPQMVARSTLQGIGKHWNVTSRFVMASMFSFAVAVSLLISGFGILSAAIGWSLVYILQGAWLYPPLICRILGQSIGRMIKVAYLPGGYVGAFVFLCAWLLSLLLPPVGITNFIVGAIVSALMGVMGILVVSGYSNTLAFVNKMTGGLVNILLKR